MRARRLGEKQLDWVQDMLEGGETLTPQDALRHASIFRLGALVYRLRHRDGFTIDTEDIRGVDKAGRPTQWARYSMPRAAFRPIGDLSLQAEGQRVQ